MYSVVVVDAHPAICFAVKATIESDGEFEVIGTPHSGPAALPMIQEKMPDLVILDLDLSPEMSGLALIGHIRSEHPAIKILVLTAQHEGILARHALRAGAGAFLSKSEDMRMVGNAAKSLMEGYSVFPHSAILALRKSGGLPLSSLTDRELTVLQQLARGMSHREIGDALVISHKTVSTFKARLFEKLGISTPGELLDFARSHDLIT